MLLIELGMFMSPRFNLPVAFEEQSRNVFLCFITLKFLLTFNLAIMTDTTDNHQHCRKGSLKIVLEQFEVSVKWKLLANHCIFV